MENLAPDIVRQRLLIEGNFAVEINSQRVESFLVGLARRLGLRTYGKPTIHSPGGAGKAENQGYDAFIPLIDSGISLYVWSEKKFFAALLFTCKEFDVDSAVSYTRDFFQAEKTAHFGF